MPGSTEPVERREVTFSGRVQGVGFRFTARNIAARFAVSGYVKNLADGRVELVAEGVASVLDRFLDELSDEMARHIESQEVSTRAAKGEYRGFEIRH